jgi:starch synthase
MWLGTLPEALHALGFDVRIILPLHHAITEKYAQELTHVTDFYFGLGWRRAVCGRGIPDAGLCAGVFFDSEFYFGHKIYGRGPVRRGAYAFSAGPFSPLCPSLSSFQTSSTAMTGTRRPSHCCCAPSTANCRWKTWHSVHYSQHCLPGLERHGLFLGDVLGIDSKYMTWEHLEMRGSGNMMKAACIFADRVNTSAQLCPRILTPEYSEGLENVLAFVQNKLSGIVNGIDMRFFDPARDSALPGHFSARRLPGKEKSQAALCAEDGPGPATAPAVHGHPRMTPPERASIWWPALSAFWNWASASCCWAPGSPGMKSAMSAFAQRHPGRGKGRDAYDEALAHRIYAAADLFLMPSALSPAASPRCWPCATARCPLSGETGGLRDTVIPYDPPPAPGQDLALRATTWTICWGPWSGPWLFYIGSKKPSASSSARPCPWDFGFSASPLNTASST